MGSFDDAVRGGCLHHRGKNENACLHEWRWSLVKQPKRSTGLALFLPGHSATKPGNKTSGRELREANHSYSCCSCALSIRRHPPTNPMTSRRYRRTPTQHRHHQKRPRAVQVRNVASLSYTTSSAFIFPSRGCSWASNSVLVALISPRPLAHLKAARLCRSKDAAGEPCVTSLSRFKARMVTRAINLPTRLH